MKVNASHTTSSIHFVRPPPSPILDITISVVHLEWLNTFTHSVHRYKQMYGHITCFSCGLLPPSLLLLIRQGGVETGVLTAPFFPSMHPSDVVQQGSPSTDTKLKHWKEMLSEIFNMCSSKNEDRVWFQCVSSYLWQVFMHSLLEMDLVHNKTVCILSE